MSECCLLPYRGDESQLNSVSHFQQRRSQTISRKRKAATAAATTAAEARAEITAVFLGSCSGIGDSGGKSK
jgi:hypothetical protein